MVHIPQIGHATSQVSLVYEHLRTFLLPQRGTAKIVHQDDKHVPPEGSVQIWAALEPRHICRESWCYGGISYHLEHLNRATYYLQAS